MLIYAFLLILFLRPSWGLLGFFALVAAALWALLGLSQVNGDYAVLVFAVGIQTAIFFAIGAVIVAIRTWIKNRKSGAEKRAEELVAQARAESAPPR